MIIKAYIVTRYREHPIINPHRYPSEPSNENDEMWDTIMSDRQIFLDKRRAKKVALILTKAAKLQKKRHYGHFVHEVRITKTT